MPVCPTVVIHEVIKSMVELSRHENQKLESSHRRRTCMCFNPYFTLPSI